MDTKNMSDKGTVKRLKTSVLKSVDSLKTRLKSQQGNDGIIWCKWPDEDLKKNKSVYWDKSKYPKKMWGS